MSIQSVALLAFGFIVIFGVTTIIIINTLLN